MLTESSTGRRASFSSGTRQSLKNGRIAALDLGEARTGVALSDPTLSLASPLEVVASGEIDGCLRRLADEEGVREVVAGVPRTMSGQTGFQAERALAEIRRLGLQTPAEAASLLRKDRDGR